MELWAVCRHHARTIMSGGEAIRAKLARHAEQVGEFRPHVTADARDGGAPGEVFVGELFHHLLAEGAFMVEHVMRDAEPVGHGTRIADIVTRAARALAARRGAIIIKLERDADHFSPARGGKRGDDRRIDPAAHRHDNAAVGGWARQIEQRGGVGPAQQAGLGKCRRIHGNRGHIAMPPPFRQPRDITQG
jgi:hypothetical protein